MHLRNLLLALLAVCASPLVSAMSLGEGRILSHVGEPFSANIALLGSYSKDVSFSQVRTAECRSSVIGTSANGCESLYEGALTLSVRQRSDGHLFLKVSGAKGDEFFYRILIKSVSAGNGTVIKTYEFLPEFSEHTDAQPAVDYDEVVPNAGKYGVVGGKVIETGSDADSMANGKKTTVPAADHKDKQPDEIRLDHRAAEIPVKKPAQTHLQIKKYGEYADDIHALRKENSEIEEQIVLLEKHIGLLKEVIRLKGQADAPVATESAVVAPSPASAPVLAPVPKAPERAPVSIQSSSDRISEEQGLLTWILLGIVLLFSVLLGWMFLKIKKLTFNSSTVNTGSAPASTLSEIKCLDLTDAFNKPKW